MTDNNDNVIRERVILASELSTKGAARSAGLAPGAALGLISGSGISRNPKDWPNEDSIALHRLPDGAWLAVVADAHFGGRAGEIVAGGACREFLAAGAGGGDARERLERALRLLDDQVYDDRLGPRGDDSSTTALLVHLDGRTLSFVNVGDSLLYVIDAESCVQLNVSRRRFPVAFVGDAPLAGVSLRLDGGTVTLEPGQVVLLATDGVEEDTSELREADLIEVVGRPDTSMQQRVDALLARADSDRHGGCRDNLGVVALAAAGRAR